MSLAPPGLSWKSQLRKPPGIVAGQDQTFTVDCVVTNTGQQTLRNVRMSVAVAHASGPGADSESYTIRVIVPGQTIRFSQGVTIYNYQYLGKVSVPNHELSVTGYDL